MVFMSETLTLYDLAPSPNNIKVRLALGLKGLAYEKIPVDPNDRATIVEVSGQPLTPVLVHGDRVLFDSSAILRYLDANFRDSIRLYDPDYDRMKRIEEWERWAGDVLSRPVAMVFGQFFTEKKDEAVFEQADALLASASSRLEEALAATDHLLGKEPTAADCQTAPWALYGMIDEAQAATNPIATFFREKLHLPEGRDQTRAWVERMMAFDVVGDA
jgi:maleylacetoacetate isomerase